MKNYAINYLIDRLGKTSEEAVELWQEFGEDDISYFEEKYSVCFDEIDKEYIDSNSAVYCEREGVYTHEDNTFYCEYSQEYFTSENYSSEEIIGDCGNYISNYWRRLSHNELNRRFGLYYNSNGEFCTEEEYYSEQEEEEEDPNYNFPYHGSSPSDLSNGESAKIGFEIEKEDFNIKTEFIAYELQDKTGWGKENDSSLDSHSGYELVSPIFPLHESMDYFISEFTQVEELINASYSKSCGGHINYSNADYYQEELLNQISGWIPLIYSLYEHRIGNTYCKAKSPDKLREEREKYQAIRIKSNCLEFRIFPAVKNVKNLLWRLRLIQIMDLNKTNSVRQVIQFMTDENHDLFKLLTEIFSLDKLIQKVNRVAYFSSNYEGEIISQDTINQFTKHIQLKLNK
jgi:hypothetical protein